jgi:hypothetical protein
MGGVMSGDKQNTNANKKITSRVVMLLVIFLSKILFLGCFGTLPDGVSCIMALYFDNAKVGYF